MAATDNRAPTGGALLAAALLLPGLAPLAQAEEPPERNAVDVKFMSYEDGQPGLGRIRVHSPTVSLTNRLGEHWASNLTLTHDDVSGASPRWHSDISSASHMHDDRNAAELQATRYFQRASLTLGASSSTEHDYRSKGLSVLGKWSTDDNNTTLSLGTSVSNDRINPVNNIVQDERKRTASWIAGVTQVLSTDDVLQFNVGYTGGHGYFSDPYKLVDNRPRSRDETTLSLGWNHYLEPFQAALRSSYRYYTNTWGVRSHTLGLEWAQPLPNGLTLTPSLRYYSQSAASFYYGPAYDPSLGAPFPVGYTLGSTAYNSPDQRLSAFGALTVGLKLDYRIDRDWSVNAGVDRYEQRSSWRLGGGGSAGLASFHANVLQLGVKWLY